MAEALLFALSFYAWATAGCSLVLYSMAFFNKRFGLISTLILSLIIYVSAPFGGRTTWFAEKFGWITQDQREIVSIIWIFLLGVAGTLSVRYLLYRDNDEQIAKEVIELKRNIANRQVWRYVIIMFLGFSVFIFFMRIIYAQ